MNLFDVMDKSGRIIYISKERWKHIVTTHPIIANSIEQIKDTLENPLFVTRDEYDKNVRFYFKYYKNIYFKEKYLIVVVKYLNGKGFIITSFYTDKIMGIK